MTNQKKVGFNWKKYHLIDKKLNIKKNKLLKYFNDFSAGFYL